MSEKVDTNSQFSEQSFMNPDPSRVKYLGRDLLIGVNESLRRMSYFPEIVKRSLEFSLANQIDVPNLIPKGSVAVEMCTPESDFDIAVLVAAFHPFLSNPVLWLKYCEHIRCTPSADFEIEPMLIVSKHNYFTISFLEGICKISTSAEGALNFPIEVKYINEK